MKRTLFVQILLLLLMSLVMAQWGSPYSITSRSITVGDDIKILSNYGIALKLVIS